MRSLCANGKISILSIFSLEKYSRLFFFFFAAFYSFCLRFEKKALNFRHQFCKWLIVAELLSISNATPFFLRSRIVTKWVSAILFTCFPLLLVKWWQYNGNWEQQQQQISNNYRVNIWQFRHEQLFIKNRVAW